MKFAYICLFVILCNKVTYGQKIVFYLHGAIVEGNCEHPTNSSYGEYKYHDIVAALRKEKLTVFSECRPADTEVKEYARKIKGQVDSLLKTGIKPADITVIGASKGAMIAMYVSTYLKNAKVNYVFMSNCNDMNFSSFPDIIFYGNVLSIYEKSDNIAGSCVAYKAKSTQAMVPNYKEIALNTGLKHGYIYRPLPEWMQPAIKWARGNYE